MTTQIRYFALQVAANRPWMAWITFVLALIAAIALTAPIGGGTGA